MEEQQRQQLQKYLDMAYRRKVMIIVFLLLAIIGGLGAYLKKGKVYESTALLIYQRARINPGSDMTPDVQTQTREMVATLTQQVTSRTSLESLIKQFSLYEKMREKLPMEDVVDVMRAKHIKILPERGDVFKVTFTGGDPKKVMQVANAVAARFIEENLRYREEKATETSAYVQDELSIAKGDLDKKEAIMRDYKLKYYNEMPQQLQANVNRLNSLQTQLQANQDSAQDLERTKILIQEQVTLRKEALAELDRQARQMHLEGLQAAVTGQQIEGNPTLARTLAEYSQLKSSLENLRSRYTEKHPEVRRLQNQLMIFEETNKEALNFSRLDNKLEGGQGENSSDDTGLEDAVLSPMRDAQLDQLKLQLDDVGYSLNRLKEDRAEISRQIEKYSKWIEMTPSREAEWSAITRDYTQLYDHYQRLVVRNLEAESAESLERRQKGSQFKIVDSAYFPEKPVEPDFKKIMLMAMALGLGVGGGLAFLLEMKDSSFRAPAELEIYLGVPVVCALPHVFTSKEKKVNRLKSFGWFMVLTLVMVCILGSMAFFYKSGRIIL